MKNLITLIQNNLGEYLERLLLTLFGVGLGVKIIVINHGVDPTTLDLTMMPADYILVIVAPLAAVGLNMLINEWIPEVDEGPDQTLEDITDDKGIIKSADLLTHKFPAKKKSKQ